MTITSDCDKLFISKFWNELFKKIDIQLHMLTAYHPETDGSSDQSNKMIIESLQQYVNAWQTDWPDYLIHVEIVMNNSVNTTTSKTLTELLYKTSIRLFPAPVKKNNITIPATTGYITRIKDSITSVRNWHAEVKTH